MFYRLSAIIAGIVAPTAAYAQYHLTYSGWSCQGFLYCPPGGGAPVNIVVIITLNIIAAVSTFIGALAIVVFLYGALRMVISQGQEGKEAGKKALIWATLGLSAALLTRLIIDYVNDYIYFIA